MRARECPACQTPLDDAAAQHCPACGHDLSVDPRPHWYAGEIDLRRVARRQRQLLWWILIVLGLNIISVVSPFYVRGAGFVFTIIVAIVQIIVLFAVLELLAAMRVHIGWRILVAFFLFAPCANLLVLLAINGRATRMLRKAGLKVSLLGVADEQVVRYLGAYRCRICGYSLIGNVSGRCPECGTPVMDAP
jgi:hypothetical protein